MYKWSAFLSAIFLLKIYLYHATHSKRYTNENIGMSSQIVQLVKREFVMKKFSILYSVI